MKQPGQIDVLFAHYSFIIQNIQHRVMTDLTLHITQSPDSWILDEFLVEYDKAFVLPDEKETSEGFRQCMLLNEGGAHDRLVSRFGPFGEFVIVAKNSQGRFVGGWDQHAGLPRAGGG